MPPKSYWARLPFPVRMTIGALSILLVVSGGIYGLAFVFRAGDPPAVQAAPREMVLPVIPPVPQPVPPPAPRLPSIRPAPSPPATAPAAGIGTHPATAEQPAARKPDLAARDTGEADRTATRAPRATPPASSAPAKAAKAKADPVVSTRTVSRTKAIPFSTQLVRDPSLDRGDKRIESPGSEGVQTLRYLVTYADGKEVDRRLLDASVTTEPRQQLVAFGADRELGGSGLGHGQLQQCGLVTNACVPVSSDDLCPGDEESAGDRHHDEQAARERGHDKYLVDPADVADLELDPGIICD
jgi:hypothetical protein